MKKTPCVEWRNNYKTQIVRQGGLSDAVWKAENLQGYLKNGGVFGYVGNSCRKMWKDRIVEDELRKQGLGARGIAEWITSGDGRHMMDDDYSNPAEFRKRVQDYTSDAFEKVTVWSHPDHTGMYDSTQRILGILKDRLAKRVYSKIDAQKSDDWVE